MVTTAAARIFGLSGHGRIGVGAVADLMVVSDGGADAAEGLLQARPADLALVIVAGRPHLARPSVAEVLDLGPPNATVEGERRWIRGDLDALRQRIEAAAGSEVLEPNPLWSMLGYTFGSES